MRASWLEKLWGRIQIRRRAESLVEVLLALLILALLLPSLWGSLGTGMSLDLSAQRAQDRLYGAEWWFNRLESPASLSALAAMPTATPDGALRFRWTAALGPRAALFVSLDVSENVRDAPTTFFRIF